MVPTACSNTHLRICLRLGLCLLSGLSFAINANSQTATYHLHREASTNANLFQLKTAGPDTASLAVQTANLKNQAVGEYLVKAFDTQSGVPNASGVITAGSTVSLTVWLRKTGNTGTMLPRLKLNLNSGAGTSICVVTGTTALSTTLTKYTLTGTVLSNVSMTATDRFYLWVGINLTASPNANNQAELDVEGTLNGNYDSQITVPLPLVSPSISSLSAGSGIVGASITVLGTNFGATQGTSTVKFNGTTASPTSWSATSITVPVPSGATTGPVVVTVNGQASNGVTFTVAPKIDSLSPTSGPVATSVTITGATFGATQGTSTVSFNGTSATPNSWSDTSIVAPVPAGSITGPVVVIAGGQTSNGVTFTVTASTGTIAGPRHKLYGGTGVNQDQTPDPAGKVAIFTPTSYFGYYYSDVSEPACPDGTDPNITDIQCGNPAAPLHGCYAYTLFNLDEPRCLESGGNQGDHDFIVFSGNAKTSSNPTYWIAGEDPADCANQDGDCNLTIMSVTALPRQH